MIIIALSFIGCITSGVVSFLLFSRHSIIVLSLGYLFGGILGYRMNSKRNSVELRKGIVKICKFMGRLELSFPHNNTLKFLCHNFDTFIRI